MNLTGSSLALYRPPDKMSASKLVYCVGVVTSPGLGPIVKETA